MNVHTDAPLKVFLLVLAAVLLFLAAFAWPVPVEPYRAKLGWAGMFFWLISNFF
jgi:hypothetical protein